MELTKNKIYKVKLVNSPHQTKTMPVAECKGASLAFRSTIFADVPSAITDIPVAYNMNAGESIKTTAGDNITFIGFTSSDVAARLEVKGFELEEL
jgi:hypothetical protein